MTLFNITPKRVLKILIALCAAFMVIYVMRLAWIQWVSPVRLGRFWERFDLNSETSVPNWFSSVVLLMASLLLWAITVEKRRLCDRFTRHWNGLAIIFLLLSIDEVATFHEALSDHLSGLHLHIGLLHFAWVIPAGLFVLLFFIAYLRFLAHLTPWFRRLFIMSGFIYVFGALVMEMVEAKIDFDQGSRLLYNLFVLVEEGCEMLGACLFVYTLLKYLQLMVSQVSIGLLPDKTIKSGQSPHSDALTADR